MATRALTSLRGLLARARASAQYAPLPVFERGTDHPPQKASSGQKKALWSILGACVILGILYEVLYYVRHRALAFPMLADPDPFQGAGFVHPLTGAGGLYRDSYPLKTMKMFWELAEKEVKASGLDECGSQVGRGLIDAYLRSNLTYCSSPDVEDGGPMMECTPVKGDTFSNWWPHQAAPCVSRNFRPVAGHKVAYYSNGCTVTPKGQELFNSMGEEKFAGTWIQNEMVPEAECKEVVGHTLIEIIRQDQWNPFHVSEDLQTTMVTAMIAAQLRPDLLETKVQLVFGDEYEIERNHYSSLYDRVGAWAPRRLSLDPWREGTCLTNTIHSINAAASIMTAMQVNHEYNCASTLAWGGAHYWRHLMGLMPYEPDASIELPINVLWLSRARYDEYAKSHDKWNNWKAWRHIDNEDELLDRFKRGLREFCETRNCEVEDTQHTGFENWHTPTKPGEPRKIRFAWIDPSVHDFGTQIYLVGHTNILMSVHSGALGLETFLPPGQGNVIEIQAPAVVGWHHYDIMSHELGHVYEMSRIMSNWANVDDHWQALERALHREWKKRDDRQGIVEEP